MRNRFVITSRAHIAIAVIITGLLFIFIASIIFLNQREKESQTTDTGMATAATNPSQTRLAITV